MSSWLTFASGPNWPPTINQEDRHTDPVAASLVNVVTTYMADQMKQERRTLRWAASPDSLIHVCFPPYRNGPATK